MISIPNPCSEDFSQMTPTERGAFCQKCSTDTFDFRNLSQNEIKQVFQKHKGEHICGRFKTSQLEALNADFYAWKNQSKPVFQSKFLLACLLVFGLGLFSCNEDQAKDLSSFSQQIVQMTEHGAENIVTSYKYVNEEIAPENLDLLDYIIQNEIEEIPEVIDCHIEETAGEIVYEVEPEMDMLGGMMVMDQSYYTYLEDTVADTTKQDLLPDPIRPDLEFKAKAFPNPTRNNSTIQLEIANEAQFDIKLYDLNGRQIQNIHQGQLSQGRKQFEVELGQLPAGMYIVQVLNGDQVETLKIQKVN